ncbi:MAG TPA: GntR family transcriptional regulator [Bordetella sp.]
MENKLDDLVTPEKRSLDRAAADSLRQAIVTGVFPPGARLTEIRLAERLSLSRGTVRAALHRLVTEGLVVQQPYTGWHVMKLTPHDAWEISTLRARFEGLGVRLTAENIDDERRKALRAGLDALGRAVRQGDHSALTSADLGLHKLIVDLSGHRRLSQHYAPVTHQIRLYIAATTAMQPSYDLVFEAHCAIVEAICAGEADKAEAMASEHCLGSGRRLVARLEEEEGAARLPRGAADAVL